MSISKKFALSLLAVIIALSFVAITVSAVKTYQNEHQVASKKASEANQNTIRLLSLSQDLISDEVRIAMKLIKEKAAQLGTPALRGETTLNGQTVPNLTFGQTSMVKSFELVDEVAAMSGGSATIFVRQGDQYIRIATNIMRNNARAVGTALNPDGDAYQKIARGDAFYGEVSILGKSYLTGYEPIRNSSGRVVGALYVGYLADLAAMEEALANARILEHGFVALLDKNRTPLAYSSHVEKADLIQTVAGEKDGWIISEEAFPKWEFSVVSAYPESDVTAIVLADAGLLILFVALSAAVILAIVLWLTNKMVIAPLTYTMSKLDQLGDGDMTVRLDEKRSDEIGEMARGFNKVLNRLQTTITDIAAASEQLSSSSEELSANASSASKEVLKQSSETEQVATAMEQMSATVNEVAKSTQFAAAAANEADQEAQRGSAVVEKTITGITSLAGQVEQTSQAIRDLSESSQEIDTVLEVIQGVAEQTNLLALNAAIEAARAGEQGRGFAVVADEVRALAARTHSSTVEIKAIIERVRENAEHADGAMNESRNTAQDCVNNAQESKVALNAILSPVAKINDLNTEIASASEEQTAVAEEITRNLINIRQSSVETNETAEQAEQASRELAEMAVNLQRRVSFFKA